MAGKNEPKWVQPVVDFFGLALFAGTYAVTRDLMSASWGMAVGSVAGLAVGLVMQKKLAVLPLVTGVTSVLFASLTLMFNDTIFIKIKLTIIDGIFAVLLLGGLAMGKQPLKAVMSLAVTLSDEAWRKLTLRYGLFFAFLAIINELLWRNSGPGLMFDEGVWVAFKFPGVLVLVFIFAIFQTPLMMKGMKDQEAADAAAELPPPPGN